MARRARDRHCYQNCVRNTTLWPALACWCSLYPAHYTLYSTIDNIGSVLRNMRGWENRKNCSPLSPISRSICDDNIWRVTSRGRGREARNVIKFYSRIIFIQIRVQSLMLALHCPEAALGQQPQTYFHSNDQKHFYLF